LPEDVDRLKDLMGLEKSKLDLHRVLPQLADAIYHDARQVGCAPEFIFQNLLAAIASLAGPLVNLRVGSRISPLILYLGKVAESGLGKTQAMNLVWSPLRRWQESARQDFEGRADEFEIAIEQWRSELKEAIKNGGEPPTKPELDPERKYLMQSFSIWAVLARLKEQAERRNGFAIVRDELKAIFAFNQFSKNDTEGMEIILEQWDGNALSLDRKNATDGFYIPPSRMSIVGGIQPGVYRQVFKDPEDSQGIQARFLFAVDETDYEEEEGACCLASTDQPGPLEQLYVYLRDLKDWPEVELSPVALERWKTVKKVIKKQAADNPHAAIRAWLRKLPAQILRLALVLHVIDCSYDANLDRATISLDTIERAIEAARYYKGCFLKLQESSSYTTDTASVMFQILDLAKRSKKGLTPREAYRKLRSLSRLARVENQKVSEFTTNLFYRLSELGIARVEKCPRTVRLFVAETADTRSVTQNGHGDTQGKVGHDEANGLAAEMQPTNGFGAYNEPSPAMANLPSVSTSLESRDTADTWAKTQSQKGFEGADTSVDTTLTLADTSVDTRAGNGRLAVAGGGCSSHIGDGHGLSTTPRPCDSSGSTSTTARDPVAQSRPTAGMGAELSGGTGFRSTQKPGTVRSGDRSLHPNGTPGNAQDGDDRGVSSTSGVHGNSNSDLAIDAASSNGKTEAHTEAKNGNGNPTETGDGDGTTESPIQWVKSRDRRLPEHLREMPLKITQVRSPKRIEVRALGDPKYHTIPLASCYAVSRHPDGLYDTYESYGT